MVFLKTDRGEVQALQIPSILYVGRGNSSDIRPDTKSVSKRHGQLTILFNAKTGKAEAWIEDFNSTFGTFVGETPENLEKITQKTRLFFGFYIRFGHAPSCYQYLELDPNDEETTCAKAAGLIESASASCSGIKISNHRGQLSADEEFAQLLQQQLNETESPPKPRTKDLVSQFESGAQWSPDSSSKNASKSNLLVEPISVRDIVQKFETSSSSRTPSPQSSVKFEGQKKKQLAKLDVESFTDSAWTESQSINPTPTFYMPPSKNSESFTSGAYRFLSDAELEEKAGPGDRSFIMTRIPPESLSVREFESTDSCRTLQLTPSGAPTEHTSAPSSNRISTPRDAQTHSRALFQTEGNTQEKIQGTAQDKDTVSGTVQPAPLVTASSKPSEPRPLSEIEQLTAEALHKKNVAIIRARQLFREQKRSVLPDVGAQYPTCGSVGKHWRKATAQVDTIPGGFCISLVLPYMEKVKVKPVGRKLNKIRVDARRWVMPQDDYACDANSEYVGEFKLQGLRSELRYEDLTFDYCERTGLLCVYVNRFALKDPRVFVAKHHFPPHLSAPVYVPVESAEEKAARANKKSRWFPSVTTWLGINKKKKERALEKNAEIYRRALNANPRAPKKAPGNGLSTEELPPVERPKEKQEPSAPPLPPNTDRPSSAMSKIPSGREFNSQKSMESLKELVDKGEVDANVEFI